MDKLEFILRRLATSILVLVGVSIITFSLARVIPSNAAALYIGPRARPADIERVTRELGLDRPLPVQYAVYMRDMLRGDWGTSIGTKRPVLQEIGDRLPATLELLLTAMLLATTIGVPLGVLSARWQGRPLDTSVRVISILGVSLPAFWLGLLLQILFFRNLEWLPLAGQYSTELRFSSPIEPVTGFLLLDAALGQNWVGLKDAALHLILPAVTLAAYPLGLIARMTRGTMLEVLEQDYIRTARAYGIRERVVIYVYALRNGIGPTLTVVGLTLAFALTGAFFVEVIFNWPGLGQFTVRSLLNVDYPAIMGITLFGAAGYVMLNLLVDILQAWVDPRISLK
ncbi:MAG: ABC transporter permease [Chloroflexota bacterium]|jgi:ABC-type dipeptide/oligopeptide/nickel transport system permease component